MDTFQSCMLCLLSNLLYFSSQSPELLKRLEKLKAQAEQKKYDAMVKNVSAQVNFMHKQLFLTYCILCSTLPSKIIGIVHLTAKICKNYLKLFC